ncbi:MAG: MerR family transcriptional regulator, partial [Thermomicrobiales bacterium]
MSEPEATADRDYTTQQTADLCGISINTLLSWERRYGVPSPRRNERGERVYTPDDLAGIRWLQAETARGIPIGVAATRFLAPDASPAAEDVVVALDPARAVEGSFPARPSASRASGQQADLIAALLRFDRSAVSHLLARLALESDPLLVAHAIILPAMRTLARRIEDGEATVVALDIGSHWIVGRLSAWLDATN